MSSKQPWEMRTFALSASTEQKIASTYPASMCPAEFAFKHICSTSKWQNPQL